MTLGHNQPPLDEQLAIETEALRLRADDLIGAVGRASVVDLETAGKATTLAAMIRAQLKAIDQAREDRKAYFLDAGRTIDRHFKSISTPLEAGAKAIMALLQQFQSAEKAKADAERARLAEEARKQAIEAQKAFAAAVTVEHQIDAQRLSDAAIAKQKAASDTAPPPIVSEYGAKALTRMVKTVEIVDLTAAIRACRKINEPAIRAVVQSIYDKMARAGSTDLPGATISETPQTVIRS